MPRSASRARRSIRTGITRSRPPPWISPSSCLSSLRQSRSRSSWQRRQVALERALRRPRVEVDAEALHRGLDPLEHARHRVALLAPELGDVVASVAVLGRLLAEPGRLDGGAEALHLRTGVVVVVLAGN